MAEIKTTQGHTIITDDRDAHILEFGKWYYRRGRGAGHVVGYHGYDTRHRVLLRRYIMEQALGRELLRSENVVHKDKNPLNCRRDNLEIATNAEVHQIPHTKVHKHSQTGVKGVELCRGKFRATFTRNKKKIHIGTFDTIQEAQAAYAVARKKEGR